MIKVIRKKVATEDMERPINSNKTNWIADFICNSLE